MPLKCQNERGKMDIENSVHELKAFLNEDMLLVALPAKYKKKLIAFYYLASKLESGKRYTESEINDVLNRWTRFDDPATLRREMYNKRLLNRTNDCKFYWKEEELPSLEEFMSKYV